MEQQKSNQKFERTILLEIADRDHYWIGVETWTITSVVGTKITKPALVKREKVKGKEGVVRTGKCKGFSLEDLVLVSERMSEIKAKLA